jgi:hypothetical protein
MVDDHLSPGVQRVLARLADFPVAVFAADCVRASDRKTITHPNVGEITLDCDVLHVPGSDQRVVLYSATPGSRDAELLEFLKVVEPVSRVV